MLLPNLNLLVIIQPFRVTVKIEKEKAERFALRSFLALIMRG